jgi:hypothetical protein
MTLRTNFLGPKPEELDKIAHGAYLMGALPVLQDEISRMMAAVQTRVFTAISAGEFSAEQAEGAWRELYAHHRLLKRLESRINTGQAVGEKHKDQLNLNLGE